MRTLIVAASLFPALALSQVPAKVGYQGRLLKADGLPEGGVVKMTFSVFGAATGGAATWTEDQSVAMTDGFYATFLGDVKPLPVGLFDGTEKYLEIATNGVPLSPRQRIASVPYAIAAHTLVGGKVDAASISVGGKQIVDATGKLTGSAAYSAGGGVTIDAKNAISLVDTCAKDQVLKYNGTSWVCAADREASYVTSAAGGLTLIAGNHLSLVTSCRGGQILKWNAATTSWGCDDDANTTYGAEAGSGLALSASNAFSLTRSCSSGQLLKWNGATNAWGCANDTDTLYTAGTGLRLAGTTFQLTDACTSGQVLKWNAGTSSWACASDTDTDTTYTAGLGGGLSLSASHTLSLLMTCGTGQILKWSRATLTWGCADDQDSGGTLTAVTAMPPLSTSGGPTPTILLSGVVPIANGGTGSATQSFVDLSGNQTIGGAKTFTSPIAASITGSAASFTGALAGDVTGTEGATTVAKLNTVPLAKVSPANGQVLTFNQTTGAWTPAVPALGSVTTVGAGAGLTGGPITTSGTLSVANGGITNAMLANSGLTLNTGSGLTGGGVVPLGGSLTLSLLTTCGNGQMLKWDTTGAKWDCAGDLNSGGTVTSVSANAPLSSSGGASPAISLAKAGATADGFLSSTDWSAFNGKLAAVSATAPMTGTGTPASPLAMAPATATANGYLSSTDWSAFNGKLGAVSATAPMTGTGTPASPLAMAPASATGSGYLSSTDWSSFNAKVSSSDARLSDARPPTAGSGNYIQNQTAAAQAAGFSISGNATIGVAGDQGYRLYLRNGASTGGFLRGTNSNNTDAIELGTQAPDEVYVAGGSNDSLLFKTGTSSTAERMRITNSGSIGIGTVSPRSELDTYRGVMTGAANDYEKAQFNMSGGGTIDWGGPGARLKWSSRFISIPVQRPETAAVGHISIGQPTTDLPASNVYDGAARSASAAGVVLKDWECLYAAHTVGGNDVALAFFIVHYTQNFVPPSNWLLVAAVNGDNATVKLGTGITLRRGERWVEGMHELPRPIIWSGGCGSHGTAGNWNDYCLNASDFNTAGDYFSVASGGTITFTRSGYYKISFYWLAYGSAGASAHARFLKNGTTFFYNHNSQAVTSNWFQQQGEQIWPFNAGDTLLVQAHNPGNYAYHSYNSQGSHSRLQVSFAGQL